MMGLFGFAATPCRYNHTLLHDRCAFTDHPDLDRRRQLFRLWPVNHKLKNKIKIKMAPKSGF